MIKEILLSAFIGGILGLGVTGGYITLQNKNISNRNNQKAVITEPTLVPTITDQQIQTESKLPDNIKLSSPEDNSLVSASKINLIGVTIPKSHIVAVTPTNSFIGESDEKGNFNISINLDTGLNIIKISSIDSNGSQKDTQLNITYSTAKI